MGSQPEFAAVIPAGVRAGYRESRADFSRGISAGGAEAARRGLQLYRQLFGQLSPLETQKPAWLLSLDGALFNIPFAALVTEQRGGNTEYLVERHSLQTVPGALLLSASADPEIQGGHRRRGEFLGVGDPIYNQADPRWSGSVSNRQVGRAVAAAGGERG